MSETRAIAVDLREMSPELAVILDKYLPLELRGKPVILTISDAMFVMGAIFGGVVLLQNAIDDEPSEDCDFRFLSRIQETIRMRIIDTVKKAHDGFFDDLQADAQIDEGFKEILEEM